MGRSTAISDEQFLQAFNREGDLKMTAASLNIALSTAYNYQRRLGLREKRKLRKLDTSMSIYERYRNTESIQGLAISLGMIPSAIRTHLLKALVHYWHNPPKDMIYPAPQKLREIKIIHALKENPELFDKPEELATRVDVGIDMVTRYLARAYSHIQAQPPVTTRTAKKGRRAKRI